MTKLQATDGGKTSITNKWEVVSIGQILSLGRGRVISRELLNDSDTGFPVYSSQTENNGILGFINTYDFEGDFLTWTTDGANAGTVFLRNGKFNCTNVCGTLRPRKPEVLILSFIKYALNIAVKEFIRFDINPKLMNGTMSRIRIKLPPLATQRAIAAFLDYKTGLIDQLIEEKEKLIQLLEEKRIALITQAVTKGLDPSVPMKPSGIEWLGDIPAHWEVKKLKYLASLQSGNAIDSELIVENGRYQVYGGNGVRGLTEDFTHDGEYILIGRQGAHCGNIHYVNSKFFATEHAVVLTPVKNIDMYWLSVVLEVMDLNQYSTSAAQPGLAVEFIASLEIPSPPLVEQHEIHSVCIKEVVNIENINSCLHSSIQKLKEYKESLIYSAVTGKIDVSDFTQGKPHEKTH